MSPTRVTKRLLGGLLAVLVAGLVDAGIGGQWDLFTLMAIAAVFSAALFLRLESRRPAVPIRRDLVGGLSRRADVAGEPLTVIADRAVADYLDRYGSAPLERETS